MGAVGVDEFGIVLFREGKVLREVGVRAAETPDDVPVWGDQVDCVGEAHGHEVVAGLVDVDGVGVHVVPAGGCRCRGGRPDVHGFREADLVERVPDVCDLASGQVDLRESSREHVRRLARPPELLQHLAVRPVVDGQGGLAIVQDVELVDIEGAEISPHGDLVGDLELVVEHDAESPVRPVVLEADDKREMRAVAYAVDGSEVERVAVVEHGGAGPDEDAIVVVDTGAHLVGQVLLRRGLWGELAVGRNEDMAGADAVAAIAMVLDVVLDCPDAGELQGTINDQ